MVKRLLLIIMILKKAGINWDYLQHKLRYMVNLLK